MTDLVEPGKAKAAGIVSILLGITALLDLICGFIYFGKGGVDGSGIWTGVGLAVCAGLGLATWRIRHKTIMVFFLAMNILWVVVCIAGVIIALLVWLIFHVIRKILEENCHMIQGTCHCSGGTDVPLKIENCDDVRIIERILLAILVLNGLGAVFTLASSIIGCMGICCAKTTHTKVVVVEQSGMAMQPTTPGVPPPDYSSGKA